VRMRRSRASMSWTLSSLSLIWSTQARRSFAVFSRRRRRESDNCSSPQVLRVESLSGSAQVVHRLNANRRWRMAFWPQG